MYKPSARQFTTLIRLQHRVDATVNGAPRPTYQDASPALHFCEFKSFHGAEAVQAGQLGVITGGTITMWYTPGVKASDRILLDDDADQIYEVVAPPEDIENRHMWLVMKVKRAVTA